jgi:hypothetical protein
MAVGSATGLLAESRSGNTWTVLSIPDPGRCNPRPTRRAPPVAS